MPLIRKALRTKIKRSHGYIVKMGLFLPHVVIFRCLCGNFRIFYFYNFDKKSGLIIEIAGLWRRPLPLPSFIKEYLF